MPSPGARAAKKTLLACTGLQSEKAAGSTTLSILGDMIYAFHAHIAYTGGWLSTNLFVPVGDSMKNWTLTGHSACL